MKKLNIVSIILLALLMTGCFVTPEETVPVEPVENPIICEGGFYVEYNALWSFTGCEGDPWYIPGVYWYNKKDDRVFYIGDRVYPDLAINVYGKCPSSYIEEIFRE